MLPKSYYAWNIINCDTILNTLPYSYFIWYIFNSINSVMQSQTGEFDLNSIMCVAYKND